MNTQVEQASTPNYAPHELRVIEERDQLEEKIGKLVKFVATDAFMHLHPNTKLLMKKQYRVMTDYSDILAERIKEFGK
jgi:hypothetical protein